MLCDVVVLAHELVSGRLDCVAAMLARRSDWRAVRADNVRSILRKYQVHSTPDAVALMDRMQFDHG